MKTPWPCYGTVLRRQADACFHYSGACPERRLYREPFLGGELVSFYEAHKRDFSALEKEIAVSLHSQKPRHHAEVLNQNPEMFDRVKRAWAVWMPASSSYGHALDSGFGYDRAGGTGKKLDNKRAAFSAGYAIRLQRVQIECGDALRVIQSRDVPDAFFYIDPPYAGVGQGHYDGYTLGDFDALLNRWRPQGKIPFEFLPDEALKELAGRNGWHTVELKMVLSMTRGHAAKRRKVEALTASYPVAVRLDGRVPGKKGTHKRGRGGAES